MPRPHLPEGGSTVREPEKLSDNCTNCLQTRLHFRLFSLQRRASCIHSDVRFMSFVECARDAMPLYASSKPCWWRQSLFLLRFFLMPAGSTIGTLLRKPT